MELGASLLGLQGAAQLWGPCTKSFSFGKQLAKLVSLWLKGIMMILLVDHPLLPQHEHFGSSIGQSVGGGGREALVIWTPWPGTMVRADSLLGSLLGLTPIACRTLFSSSLLSHSLGHWQVFLPPQFTGNYMNYDLQVFVFVRLTQREHLIMAFLFVFVSQVIFVFGKTCWKLAKAFQNTTATEYAKLNSYCFSWKGCYI